MTFTKTLLISSLSLCYILLTSDYPTPVLRWYQGGVTDVQILQLYNGVLSVDEQFEDRFDIEGQASLRINDTQFNDTSLYTVEVQAGLDGSSQSVELWISDLKPVIDDILVSSNPANENENVTFSCIRSGCQISFISWYLDGHRIIESSKYSVHNNTLVVYEVSELDNGMYTCKAENTAGFDECSLWFEVDIDSNNKKEADFSNGSKILDDDTLTKYIMKTRSRQLRTTYSGI
uniref:Titin-like n=1 Tax=Saccoglossus kowalevskii TaxID=10224 RepID=A0ABM0MT51_SACKO|nr:PREDICTED: titin-like [Saccoglossus kowalevskii]